MGEELDRFEFEPADFERFEKNLKAETAHLHALFESDGFAPGTCQIGCELEAWLVDGQARPAPQNMALLDQLQDELVVPELSTFNIEFNVPPETLAGEGLRRLEEGLAARWTRTKAVAQTLGARLMQIGILPTVEAGHLTIAHISPLNRYRALHRELQRVRDGKPICLDIQGEDHLRLEHGDVMLEAAATSFQIHLQVGQHEAVRVLNASKIAAAPIVALAANSPFLFGRHVWDEARIPLFEQAVGMGSPGWDERVTFGTDYLHHSFYEQFTHNLKRFPVLLPLEGETDPALLHHVRLHNGAIWRWVRGLIGIEEGGPPHLRIEQRVVPAGPTFIDGAANAAFYLGLAQAFAAQPEPPERRLPFQAAKENFYAAARFGLAAEVQWYGGVRLPMRTLIKDVLLPLAEEGLERAGMEPALAVRYLTVLKERLASCQNGANWQRRYLSGPAKGDLAALTQRYYELQEKGEPVHQWPVDTVGG